MIPEIAESARAGRLLIFCGAGVSMLPPSKSPSWWEIYVAAATALRERFREGFPEVTVDINLDELLKPLQTQQLADMVVQRFAGGTFVENLQVVDIADPNENHVLIAALTALGYVRGIVTTNWDTLLERSAALGGTALTVVAPGIDGQPVSGSGVPLVKLHGSAVDALRLIETSSHKAREIDPRLASSWGVMVKGADLLVLGYSGADLDFGAARAFFNDFLSSGGRIWWLYRPGSPPRLPPHVQARVTLIEGLLPDSLRGLAVALGAKSFSVPLAGRDAHLALRQVMEAWSKELHVGRWSAAVFLQSLGSLGSQSFRQSPLGVALTELARATAERFGVGAELAVDDLAAAGFLDMSGLEALTHMELDDAIAMLRAAVNIFEAMHKYLSAAPNAFMSETERLMNLSSAWSNYGQAVLLAGKNQNEFLHAFARSLRYSYLGGHAGNVLIALTNIIHYGFLYNAVRRCMRMLEGGIRIADRLGLVQSSIEMRLHLASFYLDRNEVWAASAELAEAERRAAAVFDDKYVKLATILKGHALLKRGRISDGLTTIAAVSEGDHAYIFLPVDEVRKYLEILGVPQPGPMLIHLPKDKVSETSAAIEAAIAAAKDEETLPWNGRHCSVYNSSAIDEENLKILFVLGVKEFAGDPIRAADIGLHLAGDMLRRGYFFDAYCCAKNAAANGEALPKQRALAHTFLATACAELGELGAVDRHLEEAVKAFGQAGEALPLEAVETGLWHAIQSREVAAGIEWAGRFGDAIRGKPESASHGVETALKIDTWGEPMALVGQALREAVRTALGFEVPARNTTSVPAEPFRRFMGTSAELQAAFNQKASGIMAQAQEALSQGDANQALKLLDRLKTEAPDGLPDHLSGLAASLQIQALGSKMEPAKLDRAMDVQRENMLDLLAFAGLARLESALAWQATSNGAPLLAAEILTRRGFIGELCHDPRAKASLSFWESLASELRGGRPAPGERSRWARLAARYYGTAEAQFLSRDDRNNEGAGLAKIESVAPTLRKEGSDMDSSEYSRIVRTSDDLAEVDKALASALRTLSRDPKASPTTAAEMRGERANWLLRMRRYPEAVAEYQTVEQAFRAANDPSGIFTAMAGRARALSRSGKYQDGVTVFEEALKEAGTSPHSANLLVGLAAAHLLEGTERRDPVDLTLIAKAVQVYRQAIDQTLLNDRDRANARLGLARALGEQGEQDAAMEELDRAIAELAHLASPAAKVLIENRAVFVEGGWRSLGLS